MLRRRLTALLVMLLLAPSLVMGNGRGCGMGDLVADTHAAGHVAHHAVGESLAHAADPSAPDDAPSHAPAECILVSGCGFAAVVGVTVPTDASLHPVGRVEPGAALAPDAPAPRLEPPPPRA